MLVDEAVGRVLVLGLEAGLVDAEDTLDGGRSNWMVEVLVLIEPLDAEVVLARVLEGLVDGVEVLGAAH